MEERETIDRHQSGGLSTFRQQLLDFNELSKIIEEKLNERLSSLPSHPYHSNTTNELNTALAKAQSEFKPLTFNRENPYLSLQYSDLCNIINATREALTKNGLAVIQFTQIPDDGSTILHTRLLHSSGQWFETRSRILPIKNDISEYESTLNCQKRFGYMALLGIVPTDDPGDDDGEIAMIKSDRYIANAPSEKTNLKKQSMNVISKHELEELEHELIDFPSLAESLLSKLRLNSLADLPASQYRTTLIRIRKIKEELENRKDLDASESSKF